MQLRSRVTGNGWFGRYYPSSNSRTQARLPRLNNNRRCTSFPAKRISHDGRMQDLSRA